MISLWPYHARSDAFTGSKLGKMRMFQKRILLIINGHNFLIGTTTVLIGTQQKARLTFRQF